MTPENFCYWLQGVFEVSNPQEMNKTQLDVIKEHLQLVFTKVTTHFVCDVNIDRDKILQDVKTLTKEEIDNLINKKYLKEIENTPYCKSGNIAYESYDSIAEMHKARGSVGWPPNGAIHDTVTGKQYPVDFFNVEYNGPPRSC